MATFNVTGALSHPAAFTALTEITPALLVIAAVVAMMVLEVDVPVHPFGNVQT